MRFSIPSHLSFRRADDALTDEAVRFVTDRYASIGMLERSNADVLLNDPWLPHATYYVAQDADGAVVGALRSIRHSDDCCLPTVRKFSAESALDDEWLDCAAHADAVELSQATCAPEHSGNGTSFGLYRAWFQHEGIDNPNLRVLAFTNASLLRIWREDFHFTFRDIGQPAMIYNRKMYPVTLTLSETIRHVAAQEPELLDWFLSDQAYSAA